MNPPILRRLASFAPRCVTTASRLVLSGALALQLGGAPLTHAGEESAKAASAPDPVLATMKAELTRATAELAKAENPPYFLSYTVYDQNAVILVGAYGSLLTSAAVQARRADVVMRVGSPALDNTHSQSRFSGMTSGTLPVGDNTEAIARVLGS